MKLASALESMTAGRDREVLKWVILAGTMNCKRREIVT